jgi:hypothetical protein
MFFKLRAFRATDEPQTCLRFIESHRNVLSDYGITNITTNNDTWMNNPNVYCIVAETEDFQLMGGIRIEISTQNIELPIETAIGKIDFAIYDHVKNSRLNGGIAELCALWNSRAVAGIGLSILLIRAGIAAAGQLQIKTLISICAEYTLKMFQKVGFVVNHSLGLDGIFAYPNKRYSARILDIIDIKTLATTEPFDKERIESLRNNLTQSFIEPGTNAEILVKYDLVFEKKAGSENEEV